MRKFDWNSIDENAYEFERLVPGGYICKIRSVEDVEEKEYLRIEYDIADGPFKGYFESQFNRFGGDWWQGSFIRSYKEKALPFFKQFKTAVEASNRNYHFSEDKLDELRGKYIGLVLGEEEYRKRDGEVGVRLYVAQCRGGKAIKEGDYQVPDKKFLKGEVAEVKFDNLEEDDGELPF